MFWLSSQPRRAINGKILPRQQPIKLRDLSKQMLACHIIILLTRNTCMHAATPRLTTTNNATIFSEHEVFVDCRHSNTAIYIFLYIFCKNNGKTSVLILIQSANFSIFKTFVIRTLYV